MRRLKIIALDNGAQPCYSNDGRYVLVFNGEIYNYRILRAELIAQGFRFDTESDAEVIVNLYQRAGEAFYQRLDGMFALAIYDRINDTLLLARDPVGKKPLFYALRDGVVSFSSELSSLLKDQSIPRRIDPVALDYYLRFRVVPGDRCIFQGVSKVPAGGGVSITHGQESRQNYYSLVANFPHLPAEHNLPRKVDLFNKIWQADSFPEFYQALLTDGAGGQLRQQLYSRQMALQLAEENSVAQVRSYGDELTRRPGPLSAAMEYDFNHWMQEAQMVKVDIASMANSLEVRVPFLDKQVVGLGSSLPTRFKLHAGKEKYLLHCLAKRYLPDYIVNRKKQELAVPLEQWMVSSMKTRIIDTLTSEQALSRGYFNPSRLRQFVREFDGGQSYALWTLYMLEKWHQQFIDNQE